jgi:hypothetical protein
MKENKNKHTTTKVRIVKEVFLGEFKIEDYLQKKVEFLLEKYKNNEQAPGK